MVESLGFFSMQPVSRVRDRGDHCVGEQCPDIRLILVEDVGGAPALDEKRRAVKRLSLQARPNIDVAAAQGGQVEAPLEALFRIAQQAGQQELAYLFVLNMPGENGIRIGPTADVLQIDGRQPLKDTVVLAGVL